MSLFINKNISTATAKGQNSLFAKSAAAPVSEKSAAAPDDKVSLSSKQTGAAKGTLSANEARPMSKEEVLMHAGMAMLVQANANVRSTLQLLNPPDSQTK